MPLPTPDRMGQRYGRLTVIGRSDGAGKGHVMWRCECACGSGKLTIVRGGHLADGNVRSCGCLRTEAALNATHNFHRIVHGMSKRGQITPEYQSYHHARRRCENPNDDAFASYGGRGIKFLYGSFQEFFADLGPKPRPGLSLERIDNSGHYEPGNCRWATSLEQNNNRRNNRLLPAFGKVQTLSKWAQEYHIPVPTLYCRLRRGTILEKALVQQRWVR